MRKPRVLLVVGGPCSPHQGQFLFGRVKYELCFLLHPSHPVVSECFTQHVISHAQAESRVMQDSTWTEGQACPVSLGDMMAL